MLLDPKRSCLVVVDVQERLAPKIAGGAEIILNINRLVEAAERLGVPVLLTEQYPDGLGRTVPELACRIPPANRVEKNFFAAGREEGFRRRFAATGRDRPVLCGMETHVCVLQSALDLAGREFAVAVVANAVGSRRALDRDSALRRFDRHGVELVTVEMALFEWLERAPGAAFRDLLPLIR
jgi:nicotinamidase-related amidase